MPEKHLSEYTSDGELNSIMESAKQHNDKELWWKCLHRRCELKRQGVSEKGSPLDLEFYAVMLAYETVQAELRRKKEYRAIRTWKMFEKTDRRRFSRNGQETSPRGAPSRSLLIKMHMS
jgi:hypothetical protein